MSTLFQLLIIFGSLGVFLYGMRMMSEGLQQAAGSRLQRILAYMTSNRFAGVASGFLITTVVQSSSATTVMVVSFVDAALLTLRQAIGVIMGANIGTTVTAWIVALLGFKFSITSAALPAIAVGTAMLLISKIDRDDMAHVLIGFGFLFLGLSLLKDAVPDIRNNPEVLRFLANYTDLGFLSFLLFVLVGTLLTVVVQSSSAAMAITLTMTFNGWIDYPTAAAIVLGENIGTTVTAYIASLNSGTNAKRAARAHTFFNLFGVLWMALLFNPALALVDALVPGSIASRTDIASHLAMFHTLFNLTNTAICIGFVPLFEKPKKNVRARRNELKETLALVEKMQEEITSFLVECSRENVSEQTATNLNGMVRIAAQLESIADTSNKLIKLADRKAEKDIKLEDSLMEEIRSYSRMVSDFLSFNKTHLRNHLTEEQYHRATEMEEKINAFQKKYKKAAQKRLRTGSAVKAELFYLDILRHLEHLGDFSLNISQALKEVR